MFNSQHWKIKLAYATFGLLCAVIGMLLSPVTAQRDKFQEIECTKLTLIDPITGKTTAELETDEHGGILYLYGAKNNRSAAKLYVDKDGGRLYMFSNEDVGDAHVSAMILTSEDGTGSVSVHQKNGAGTSISAIENGGYMSIYGAKHKKLLASIGVTDDGESGLISVNRYEHGKDIGSAQLSANKNGGRLSIYGKTDHSSRVVVGINEYGNGVVSTWDKNGYRQ